MASSANDPGLGLGRAILVEAVGRTPEVFDDVNDVEMDRHLGAAAGAKGPASDGPGEGPLPREGQNCMTNFQDSTPIQFTFEPGSRLVLV